MGLNVDSSCYLNWAFFTFSWNGHSCEILAFNNVHVGRIARRQASIGGFAPETIPSPPSPVASAFEDEDDDDGDDNDASDNADRDASSTDEMST